MIHLTTIDAVDKHFAALDTVVPSAVIADVDLPHLSHDGTTGLERQMVVSELKQLGAVAGALAPLGAAAVAGAEPQESSIWNPRRIDKMRGTANPLPPEVGRAPRQPRLAPVCVSQKTNLYERRQYFSSSIQ